MKKNVCLYAMMALAVMGCSQNNKKQEGSSKGLRLGQRRLISQ